MTREALKEGPFDREKKLEMARGEVPMGEKDLLSVLTNLLSDNDEEIRKEALATILREWGRLQPFITSLSLRELIQLEKALVSHPEKVREVREVKASRGEEVEARDLYSESVSLDEEKRGSILKRLLNMTVVEKIKLALFGNREVRSILIKDPNRVVATAVLQNPRITEDEVIRIAQSRNVCDDVLRAIASSREWTRNYQVKLALVQNPKTPLSISLKFLPHLYERDLQNISKSKNIPTALSMAARKMIGEKRRHG